MTMDEREFGGPSFRQGSPGGQPGKAPSAGGAIRTLLNYEEQHRRFERFLASKESEVMVLATSHQHRVFARSVLVAARGIELHLFTWRHSRKCMHIASNAHVALCQGAVQIEGTAEILGSLTDPQNRAYRDLLGSRFPKEIKRWLKRPNMVVIRVRPAIVMTAGSAGKDPSIEVLDLESQTAYVEKWAHY
ncbi:hypothetical protein JXA88_17205 [Candidatus Fermentibacteria bacterium]|nr:hypothetical protein [Candidatus Fermentibacteria bacterium]